MFVYLSIIQDLSMYQADNLKSIKTVVISLKNLFKTDKLDKNGFLNKKKRKMIRNLYYRLNFSYF